MKLEVSDIDSMMVNRENERFYLKESLNLGRSQSSIRIGGMQTHYGFEGTSCTECVDRVS